MKELKGGEIIMNYSISDLLKTQISTEISESEKALKLVEDYQTIEEPLPSIIFALKTRIRILKENKENMLPKFKRVAERKF